MGNKNLLALLFDLSFREFLTTRIIKILFVIGIVFSALGAFVLIVSAFASSLGAGIVALIFAPIIFLLYVVFARIYCELLIVAFRIAENTGEMVEQGKKSE